MQQINKDSKLLSLLLTKLDTNLKINTICSLSFLIHPWPQKQGHGHHTWCESGDTGKQGYGYAKFQRVSRFGLTVRLVSGRTSVRYRFGSPFSSERLWFVDIVLRLCPSLPTETLKWLSSLPILMQESFWW